MKKLLIILMILFLPTILAINNESNEIFLYGQETNLPTNFYEINNLTTYNNTWLDFNGSTDYIYVDNNFTLPTQKYMTIYTYLKFNDNDTKMRPFQLKGNGLYATVGGSSKNRYYCGIINESNTERSDYKLLSDNFDEWGSLTCRYNYSHIDAIFNATSSGSPFKVGGKIKAITGVYIGQQGSGIDFWNGSINNFIIYNRSLSYDEINLLHKLKGNINYSLNQTINKTEIIKQMWLIDCNKSGTCYGYKTSGGYPHGIYKSTDNFKTNINVHNFTDNVTSIRNIFIDSKNNIFVDRTGTGVDFSYNTDTNWSRSLNFTCRGTDPYGEISNGSMWSMTEDNNSYLYIGEYSTGSSSQQCAFIYKSIDGGNTWNITMNATKLFEAYSKVRHVHNVKYNPYNKCIYASLGDNVVFTNASRIIKSCDTGQTWTTILTGDNANIITIDFTPNYRFFGEDETDAKIRRTNDDINFETVYQFEDSYIWASTKDNNGIIYIGTVKSSGIDNYQQIMATSDEGDNWYLIDEMIKSNQYGGYQWLKTMDINGNIFVQNGSNSFILNIADLTNPSLYLPLDENKGTKTYDLSKTLANGTIYTSQWNNDNIIKRLNENIDFTISNDKINLLKENYDKRNYLINYIQDCGIILGGTLLSNKASNCTYIPIRNMECSYYTLDSLCLNITGGYYEGSFCRDCGLIPQTFLLITNVETNLNENCYTNPFFSEGNIRLLGIIPMGIFGAIIIMFIWNWKWGKKQHYKLYVFMTITALIAIWILGTLLSGMGC